MRRDEQRLNDILDALDWIAKVVAGLTEAEFLADETRCYAVAQRLTVVGEAVARLTPESRRATTLFRGRTSWGSVTSWSTNISASIGRLSGRPRSTTRQSCGSRSRRFYASSFPNRLAGADFAVIGSNLSFECYGLETVLSTLQGSTFSAPSPRSIRAQQNSV
jgi:hypothetical protein